MTLMNYKTSLSLVFCHLILVFFIEYIIVEQKQRTFTIHVRCLSGSMASASRLLSAFQILPNNRALMATDSEIITRIWQIEWWLCITPCGPRVDHMRGKRKKLITPTDGCPIQCKCQKDSHDSQTTCEKEHSAANTMDLQMVCACRDDGEPITNVSVSPRFQGQNNLCVWKQLRTPRSHLFRVVIFAVRKCRMQIEHFFEKRSFFRLVKTVAGGHIMRFVQMQVVCHTLQVGFEKGAFSRAMFHHRSGRLKCKLASISFPFSYFFTLYSHREDLNEKAVPSFEAKGIRVSAKRHSLPARSHRIHMLMLASQRLVAEFTVRNSL